MTPILLFADVPAVQGDNHPRAEGARQRQGECSATGKLRMQHRREDEGVVARRSVHAGIGQGWKLEWRYTTDMAEQQSANPAQRPVSTQTHRPVTDDRG